MLHKFGLKQHGLKQHCSDEAYFKASVSNFVCWK